MGFASPAAGSLATAAGAASLERASEPVRASFFAPRVEAEAAFGASGGDPRGAAGGGAASAAGAGASIAGGGGVAAAGTGGGGRAGVDVASGAGVAGAGGAAVGGGSEASGSGASAPDSSLVPELATTGNMAPHDLQKRRVASFANPHSGH
jgi:hypothetical protein